MIFKDVIGQHAIRQQLQDLEANNRLSHAILFIGKEGTGALPLAINFAQNLLTSPPKAAPKAPEVADLFGGFSALPAEPAPEIAVPHSTIDHKAAQLLHPDLHFSYPVIAKKTDEKPISTDFIQEWRTFYKNQPYGNLYDWLQSIKAENKQGNITARECNEIIRKLSLKAFEAPYKILVMWMPEMLDKEGNKLLKMIEEPPPDTIFLLVAENEDQVLPTIVSRCQIIRVSPLEEAEIEEALIQQANMPPDEARHIALVCEGNYHEALQMKQHSGEDWNGLLKDWLNATALRGASETKRFKMQSDVIARLADLGREKQKQLLRYFLKLLEQSIRLRLIGEQHLHLPETEKDLALRLNKMSGINTQQAIIKEIESAIYFVERNANAKMLFHALSIKLRYIMLDKTVLLTN